METGKGGRLWVMSQSRKLAESLELSVSLPLSGFEAVLESVTRDSVLQFSSSLQRRLGRSGQGRDGQ